MHFPTHFAQFLLVIPFLYALHRAFVISILVLVAILPFRKRRTALLLSIEALVSKTSFSIKIANSWAVVDFSVILLPFQSTASSGYTKPRKDFFLLAQLGGAKTFYFANISFKYSPVWEF